MSARDEHDGRDDPPPLLKALAISAWSTLAATALAVAIAVALALLTQGPPA